MHRQKRQLSYQNSYPSWPFSSAILDDETDVLRRLRCLHLDLPQFWNVAKYPQKHRLLKPPASSYL